MNNALIFSPRFDGHRQVHVFVYAQILKEAGFHVSIAGNMNQSLHDSFYVKELEKNEDFSIINTAQFYEGGIKITTDQLIDLQIKSKADLTVFPEADHHFTLLNASAFNKKNRLRGRVVGHFMRPFYFYRKTGLLDRLRFLKHFGSRWKKDEQMFYEFFLKHFNLLDASLCIDEYYVSKHRYVKWIPDVFQRYAEIIFPVQRTEQRAWIDKLNDFKEKNKGKFLFLYFGTAQERRGYDLLMKLAYDTGGCFVHCGLRNKNERFEYDTDQLRVSLIKDDRLFETDEYIVDPFCIESFFKSSTHLILPYRKYLGSSGVMLQALEYGIPVLSPDYGVTGYRIKEYKLGKTYKYKGGNEGEALLKQFKLFRDEDPVCYSKAIEEFMKFQSVEQLKNILVYSFTGSDHSISGSGIK